MAAVRPGRRHCINPRAIASVIESREGALQFSTAATALKLSAFALREHEAFFYVYDFNAWWRHDIRVEQRVLTQHIELLPRRMAGCGACRPEDIGGVERLLEEPWRLEKIGANRLYQIPFAIAMLYLRWRKALQSRRAGAGFKQPQAASVGNAAVVNVTVKGVVEHVMYGVDR
ncbi:hypothetical protein CTP10_R68490 (plasmid) [Cupriavidus sp. P-10]|nr:hypothetical protein CTP10_R68490 [Cupriavidus sp. P-10]